MIYFLSHLPWDVFAVMTVQVACIWIAIRCNRRMEWDNRVRFIVAQVTLYSIAGLSLYALLVVAMKYKSIDL